MSQALCSFCSRHESSVIVICESRCLLCNRCQNSAPVKKLLVDYFHKFGAYNAGYDSYASNASYLDINSNKDERKIGCPICSHPLAPQMIESIQMIIEQLQKSNSIPTYDETGRLFGDLDFKDLPNPFIAFIQRYRQTYNDPSAMIIGERPPTADGTNEIKAPPITTKKESQQQMVLEISNNRKLAAAATEVIIDCYCNVWSLLLKNETESMTDTAIKLCSRKKLSSKTNDLKAKSIVDFFGSPAALTSAQFFLFGRLLGLLPKRSKFIRQSWGPIAVVITVMACCDKCLRRGALVVKEGTPTVQEFRTKLGKAPGTKIISLARAFTIINFMIDSNQPHWCISPMSSSSVENNIPLPWSAESKSKLLHLIFYALGFDSDDSTSKTDSNANAFTTEMQSHPPSPANRRLSSPDIPRSRAATRKSTLSGDKIKFEQTEISMAILQSLQAQAQKIWSCQLNKTSGSSGFASLNLGKVINDKITNVSFGQVSGYVSGLSMSVAELALICITAWETEYLYLEDYSSRAVIRRERRPAIAGSYVETKATALPAEKFAIYRIMDFYERQGQTGVDWQEVYDNFHLERKIFPFKIPETLLSKSQAELDYLANSLKDEKEQQRIIERKEDLLAADGPYSKVLLKKSHAKLAGLDSVAYATVLNKIVSKKEYNQAYDVIGLSRDQRDALSRGQFIASQGLQGTDPFPEIDEEMKVLNLSTFPTRAAYPLPANFDPSLPLELMERTLTPHRLAPLDTTFTYQDGEGLEYPQSEYIDLEDDDPFHPSTSDDAQPVQYMEGSVVSLDGPSTHFDEEGRPKQFDNNFNMEESDKYTEDVLMLASAANQIKLTEDAEHNPQLYTTTGLFTSKGLETDHVIPKTPLVESRPVSRGVALSKQSYSGPNPGRHSVNLVDVINHRNYDVLTEVGMLEGTRELEVDNTFNEFSLLSSPSRLNVISAARDRVRNRAVKNATEYETMFLNESIVSRSSDLGSSLALDGNDTVRGLVPNRVGPNGENGGIVMNLNINNYIDRNENSMESRRSAEITVESLSLCNTTITREGFASAVARYLNEPQLLKIRKIDFSNNKLTYHSGIVLANQLRRVCRLVHLTLDNNTLGDNGVGKVLDAIVESGGAPVLVRLELRNNNITLGTKALAKLPSFKNIKALDLGNNCITVDTKHQKQLFTSIFQSLTNLVFLSLCNNKIKDDGFNILMNEIMPRDNVQRLNLSNCFITSKSIKLIQAIVSKECSNRKYEFFILQGHLINSELLPELRYMINNHSLNIHFDGNQSSSIEYPLLYDDGILNAMNDNEMKGENSDKQASDVTQLSELNPNKKKQSPKDYYDNEELQQKLLKEKALNAMKVVNEELQENE